MIDMTTAEFPAYVNVVVIFPLGLARGGSEVGTNRGLNFKPLFVPTWDPHFLHHGPGPGPCPPLGRAPGLCQLCGWALWLGLVLLLSSSWPRP